MALAASEFERRAADVRLAAFDVDGVLTDGRIILGPSGEEYKAFHVRDGHGLVALKRAGITIAIITGRRSAVVDARMRELGVEHVHQGVNDKGACLADVLTASGTPAHAALYVGDDEPDLAPLAMVGLPIAVADAIASVRAVAAWITAAPGGHGAVREVCDRVLAARAAVRADA